MPTVFTRVISGEWPGEFLWRDDRVAVFLSINPLRPGHALVVPIDEVEDWLGLTPDLRDHVMHVAHAVGAATKAAYAPLRVGMMCAGLEVPHCHVHVVQMNAATDLDFANAAESVPPDELAREGARLRAALRDLGHGAHVPAR